jgi:sulfate transport system permease protein
MNAVVDNQAIAAPAPVRRATDNYLEPAWVRYALIAVALVFLTLFLFIPLVAVFTEALKNGWHTYVESVLDPDALSAWQRRGPSPSSTSAARACCSR